MLLEQTGEAELGPLVGNEQAREQGHESRRIEQVEQHRIRRFLVPLRELRHQARVKALDGKVDMSTMQALLENKTNLLDFEALSLTVEGKAEAADVASLAGVAWGDMECVVDRFLFFVARSR